MVEVLLCPLVVLRVIRNPLHLLVLVVVLPRPRLGSLLLRLRLRLRLWLRIWLWFLLLLLLVLLLLLLLRRRCDGGWVCADAAVKWKRGKELRLRVFSDRLSTQKASQGLCRKRQGNENRPA